MTLDTTTEATTEATTETTPATDTAPADQPGTEPTDAPAADPSEALPEEPADLEYKFELPEGVELDPELGAEFQAFAESKKLSKEEVAGLLALREKETQKQRDAFVAEQEKWVADIKADKEIGGDKFDENLAVAKQALATFGTPGLKDLLNSTGFGNHPEVIKAFVKIGKAVGEDKLVQRDAATPAPIETLADRMYPTLKKS